MQHATLTNYFSAHDALKAYCRCKFSNIFLDSATLEKLLAEKTCFLHMTDGALFLFIPMHELFYDCLYIAADEILLDEGLKTICAEQELALDIRVSIIGKEPGAGVQAELFQRHGFSLSKKLLRTRLEEVPKKIVDAMRPFAEEYRGCASFAVQEDAEEISALLKENFDPVGDNLPELAAIRENIARQQVAVLRQDGRIAALHYFQRQHNTLHALYDVTRKEYRRKGLFMALAMFMHEYFMASKKCTRALGWRDATQERLVRYAKKSNQNHDGVCIYNLLYSCDVTRF